MAKINRITRGSSSLVTLAELQSGSQLFTKTVINKTQITPELRDNNVLVKRAELVRRVIDHIVYADRVSGVQVFAEYLLPVDSPLLLFIRGRFVNDTVSVTDDDAFLVPGKGFSETLQATDERLQLLIQAFRLFQDAALMQSRPALRLDKPLPTDTVGVRDLPSLEPGIGVFDSLLAADVSNLLVVFGRILQDAVQVADLESFVIGKALFDENTVQEDPVFSLGKVLADAVAEIDNVALRAELLKQDSIAFADRTTLSSALGKFDDVTTLDQLFKAVSITKADAVIIQDQTSRVPGKGLADQTSFTDRLAQQVIKALADVATAIDLAGVFDGITYSYGLSRAFSVDATDQLRLATTYFRTLDPDAVSLLDVLRLSQGYGLPLFDDQTVLDRNQLLIGLGPRDSQELADQFIRTIVTSRLFQDEELTEDRKALFLDKALLTDAVSFTDLVLAILFKLISLTDAQTVADASRLAIGLGKADEQTTADQTSRLLDKVLADANDLQDFLRFDVVKNLADTAITLDLAGVFDGITYSYGLNRSEDIFAADQFARTFSAQRVFEDDEFIQDEFRRVFGVNIFLTDTQDQPTDLVSLEPGKGFLDRVGEFTVYIDSPQDILYDRELGQNFTSSQLFTLTSVTTDVAVTSSGTGAGQFEGFYAPAIASVGPGTGNPAGGNYVLFTGSGSRSLTTVPLDTTSGQNVVFTYIAGNTSNGGDRPEAGENLVLEYSTDLGTSFTTTATIWTGATLWPDGADWRTTSIAMPAASKTTATLWRWRQTGSPTPANADNYGLFNIYVGGTSVVFVGTIPDADFYSLTKGLRENVDQPDSVRRAHTALRREADLLDLRTPDFERFSTSVTSSISTSLAVSLSTPSRATVSSTSTQWFNLAALTTSVFVLSRNAAETTWGVRSAATGFSWSPVNFGFRNQKFASDGLVGNTSMAVLDATTSVLKSTDRGASWSTFGAALSITGSQYYLPHWDSNRRIFIAFHRRSISGGKSPTTYNWRYDYSNNQLTSWTDATPHVTTTSTAATGDFPAGVASGILDSNGCTVLINLNGTGWVLGSSNAIGTAFFNRGNNLPGWPGEISTSYLDNNLLTFGSGGAGGGQVGQFVFVYPASGGPVWRTTSVTLSLWYSSTLAGAAVPQEIFWDTSLSRYVIVGELSAGVPIIWTSTDAATWNSSTSTTGSVFVDGAVIQAALVPGASTSGTSTLVGVEVSNTISSVLVIPLSVVNVVTTSFSTSVTALPTPRGAELPSATRYTVNKSARAGQQYTIDFKGADGTSLTTSLVFTTSVGTGLSIVTTSDASIAALTTSSGVFTNSNIWDSANSIVSGAAGPGTGNGGGFATYEQYFFNGSGARILTTKSFSNGISSITFRHIAGSSTNGGETPDGNGEQLILQYLSSSTGTWVTATTVNFNTASWTLTSIVLLFRPTRIRLAQLSSSGLNTDNYGVADVSMSVTSVVTGVTSVTTSIAIAGTTHPLDSSVALTYTSSDTDRVGTVDTWRRLISVNRVFEDAAPPLDAERFTLIKPISSVNVVIGFGVGNFGQRVSGDDLERTAFNITKPARRSVDGLVTIKTLDGGGLGQYQTSVTATTSAATVLTDGYFSSVGSSFESSVVFSPSRSNKEFVDDPGTGTGSSGGFGTYRHVWFIGGSILSGTGRWATSLDLDLRNVDRITFQWIVGSGSNGRPLHDGSIPFYFEILPSPGNSVTSSATIFSGGTINTWQDFTYNLSPSQRTSAAIIRIRNDSVVSNSQEPYAAFTNVRLVSSTGTVTFTTSVTFLGISDWQQSSVTISQNSQQPDLVGAVDDWRRVFDSKRPFDDVLTATVSRIAKLLIPATLTDTVSVEDSYSLVTDGLTYDGTKIVRDTQLVSDDKFLFINIDAKAGAVSTVSGITVQARDRDQIFVGQQYGNIRFSGDAQERISFTVNKNTGHAVVAGIGYDQRSANEERSFFTIAKLATVGTDPVTAGFGTGLFGVRVSGDDAERIGFNVSLRAKQGASVTVSGVTVAATSTTDIVRIGQQYGVIRFSGDAQERIRLDVNKAISSINIRAGSGVDQARGNVLERLVFSITKRIGDDVIPDDFLQTFDGLTYRVNMLEREVLTAGITPAIGIRVTGSSLENTAFDFSLRAKQGASVTVSGVTVAATSTTEIIRAGQQYGLIRFSGDRQERISFDITKPMTSTPVLAGADSLGSRHEARSSSETTVFTVGKRATVGTDPVTLGFGTGLFGARVSGDDAERTSFNVGLRAKQGASVTVSGVTVAATSTTDIVRVGQRYGAIRFSGDQQERISINFTKIADNIDTSASSIVTVPADSVIVSDTPTGSLPTPLFDTYGRLVGPYAAGTGTGNSGGFDTYVHYKVESTTFFDSPLRFIASRALDFTNVGRIAFRWIRGTGSNGHPLHDGNPAFLFEILPSPGNSTTATVTVYNGGASGATWTETSITLTAAQRTSAAVIRFRNDAEGDLTSAPVVGFTDIRLFSLNATTSISMVGGSARVTVSDDQRRFANYRRPVELDFFTESRFSYLLTQPRREELLASDAVIISNLLFRSLDDTLINPQGDLDPFGNINTMVSNGSLRMTDYVDIEYLENDYVGESRSFS